MDAVLTIRPMSLDDIDTVVAVEQQSSFMPWPAEILQACLRDDYLNLVLLANNVLVGFSICSRVTDEATLQNICVDARQQGQGWGRQLLQHTLTALQQAQVHKVFLEVRRSNTAAIALYQSTGFHKIGERRDYYPAPVGREDAWVYQLHLDSKQ